jgi:serine/threonine protein phosphatase 1
MSFTYAIPDVHGRLDLFESALDKIVMHSAGSTATVVTLGDYIDRGPDSFQVIERLMTWRSERITLVALKGNHEAMMWEVCNRLAELNWWTENGGAQTLASYGCLSDEIPNLNLVPDSHLEWIAELPLMYVDQYRVFVHAGVDPTVSLDEQSERTLLWKRYPEGFSSGHGQRHVVHGHHANSKAPIITKFKTNLDGLAWKTGRLVIGVFDDHLAGGASEFLVVEGAMGS